MDLSTESRTKQPEAGLLIAESGIKHNHEYNDFYSYYLSDGGSNLHHSFL
ncbi:hypothetical protein O9992_18900 [Vibrio lentus]|nr:hypothetical protein [Vibrio lentus]